MENNFFSFRRFLAIAKKEFIQAKRDPISLRIPIVMPLLWMLLFSYAISTDVDKIPTVVFDQSRTTESRQYIDKFVSSSYFIISYNVSNQDELTQLIDNGSAKAALIIPPDYSESIKQNRSTEVQLIIDGTEPTTARAALNSGSMISQTYLSDQTQTLLKKIGHSSANNLPNINLSTRVWYNPNMESKIFIVPGLIGLVLQNITTFLTAFALVREMERGTIEQLMVTTIKPAELILGKIVPYVVIGLVDLFVLILISTLWFNIHILGSMFILIISGFIFILCSLALGILLSTFSKTQTQSLLLSIMILLPSVLISGFMFPRESMPKFIYWLSNAIPLTYFLNITRGIVLKGASFIDIWDNILALCIFTFILLSISILRFRKSLD